MYVLQQWFMVIKYLILSISLIFFGCAEGVYTNVTKPYSTDFNETPVGTKSCILKEYGISEPVSGNNISVTWSADIIQYAAQSAGITSISYIEEHYISFFFGVYHRRMLIIYGD